MSEPWEQRFRAPTLSFPSWAIHAPERLVLSSNESGAWQVYAWDRAAGHRRQVTDHPIGVLGGGPTPDGEGVVWFHDVTGDEVGHYGRPPLPSPANGSYSQYTDTFMPDVQAWLDHGLAVAMVNYRGSTGYGTAFRDALIGDPGLPEVEDVVAGLDSLVTDGVADPRRAVVAGGSWGGYVTLLALGLHPQRWAAAVAAVPVADYVTAYRDEAPTLQAFDRSLFGGSPDELPGLYEERSPLTYVDRVTAPVLVIAGDHDSRCPLQQVVNYTEALEARGGEVELYRFDAGHGSMVIDERVRQMRAELDFVVPRITTDP